MAPITLRGTTIDPSNAPEGTLPRDAADTNFILVQTIHPLAAEEAEALFALGVQVQRRQDNENTYLCRYEPSDLACIEELPFVRHAIVYHQDFVINQFLKDVDFHEPHPHLTSVGRNTRTGEYLYDVDIALHQDTTEHGNDVYDMLLQMISEDAPPQKINSNGQKLRAHLPMSILSAVAAIDCVLSISPATRCVPDTMMACEVMEVGRYSGGYSNALSINILTARKQAWTGKGQTIVITDTGIDNNLAFQNRIVNVGSTWELADPLIKSKTLSFPLEDTHPRSHGTHVAGCAAGNWEYQAPPPSQSMFSYLPFSNPAKQRAARGTWGVCGPAPDAKLYIQIHDSGSQLNEYDYLMDAKSVHIEAKIHSVSYGWRHIQDAMALAEYDDGASRIDEFMDIRDDYLVVRSAGNSAEFMTAVDKVSGAVYNRQIGAMAAAKNCLTVGATHNRRLLQPLPWDYPERNVYTPPIPLHDAVTRDGDLQGVDKGKYDHGRVKPQEVAQPGLCYFSSKGPTAPSYLLKPDLVAPGSGILSAFSQSRASQDAKAGGPTFFNTYYADDNYSEFEQLQFASGTSMSAPLVAGIAACIREALESRVGVFNRQTVSMDMCYDVLANTVKAIIINTAVSLKGGKFYYRTGINNYLDQGTLGDPPDCLQGFGLVNYRRCMIPIDPTVRLTPDPTLGYAWAGFHQVDKYRTGVGAFTAPNEVWPDTTIQDTDRNAQLKRMASYIEWIPELGHQQLRVTLAYNDMYGETLQHDLRLVVIQQIVRADGTVDSIDWRYSDPINGYDVLGPRQLSSGPTNSSAMKPTIIGSELDANAVNKPTNQPATNPATTTAPTNPPAIPADFKNDPELNQTPEQIARAKLVGMYGPIRKVTWKDIHVSSSSSSNPGNNVPRANEKRLAQGERMRFQVKVWARAFTITPHKLQTGFSLCWLASKDQYF